MQSKTTTEAIECLNKLIGVCEDGEAGYRKAAELTTDKHLRSVFLTYEAQRREFSKSLRSEVSRLGGDAKTSGTLAGSAHRVWFEVKTAFTADDAKAVIQECERGEDHALQAFRDAIREPLPNPARELVMEQCSRVMEAHGNVRALQNAYNRD